MKINFVEPSSSSEDVLVPFSWSVTGKKWPAANISHSETVGGKTFQRFAKSWGGYYCSTKGGSVVEKVELKKLVCQDLLHTEIKSGGSGLKPPLGWSPNFLMCILSFAFNLKLTFFLHYSGAGPFWCCWCWDEAACITLYLLVVWCNQFEKGASPPLYSDLQMYIHFHFRSQQKENIQNKSKVILHCNVQGLEIIHSH